MNRFQLSVSGNLVIIFGSLLFCFTAVAQDVDTDGDGLSDFHEQYKYFTNPKSADSDGDGISDGEWRERREYQYIVRSVVQVMRPVTMNYLNDDFQDARILDETANWVELEIIHYPFNKVASAIRSDDNWRERFEVLRWDWSNGWSRDQLPTGPRKCKLRFWPHWLLTELI